MSEDFSLGGNVVFRGLGGGEEKRVDLKPLLCGQ